MLGNEPEDIVTCEKGCVEVKRALSNMRVRKGHVETDTTEIAAQVTEINPVFEWRFMNGHLLKQLTNSQTNRRVVRPGQDFSNDERGQEERNFAENAAQRIERTSAQVIDQD
jgi:hypothetical protein